MLVLRVNILNYNLINNISLINKKTFLSIYGDYTIFNRKHGTEVQKPMFEAWANH